MSTSFCVRARWVLPIDRPPLADAWVHVAEGRVAGVGQGRSPAEARDLGDVAILPGLVNAHTHLELSWMAGLVPPAASMDVWIRALLRVRAGASPGFDAEREAAVFAAHAMRDAGTVLVGDISNSLAFVDVLGDAGVGGVVFHELIGFNPDDPERIVRESRARVEERARELGAGRAHDLRLTAAAHAPYSVAPGLFRAIAAQRSSLPLTVHLGESPEEVEFLRTGRGPLRRLLEDLGVWTDAWDVPACDPVQYMHRLGYLGRGMLAVHAVHLGDEALAHLRAIDAAVVTCPRSNLWVGAGMPRIAHFYAAGVRVAIGTDSLASVASLSVFDELAELRRIAPDVAAASLLESATRVGAAVLGFGDSHGTISPGKRAALIAVDVPRGVSDVEEYLVGGVPKGTIRHLAA